MTASLDFGPFLELSPEARARLLAESRRVEMRQGDVLIRELSASSGCYVLLSGTLVVQDRDGKALATHEAPSLVGEIGPVLSRPRSATVMVERSGEALFLPVIALREAIADAPEFEKALRDFIEGRLS